MKRGLMIGALLTVCCNGPAWAEAIQEKRIVSGKQQLNPDKAYVFMHAPVRAAITLIKVPTETELEAYQAEWQAAFEEARSKYARRIADWPEDVESARRRGRPRPERPIEPTTENFQFESLDRRMMVGFGYFSEYEKGEDYYSYLQELEPGTYIYYRSTSALHGACMCMGTVSFEVEAGKITNLGDFPTMRWVGVEQAQEAQVDWIPADPPRPVDYALPARLAAFPNVQADWRAFGKINNFDGILVARMPPIPGVLAYERDRVIDFKSVDASIGADAP